MHSNRQHSSSHRSGFRGFLRFLLILGLAGVPHLSASQFILKLTTSSTGKDAAVAFDVPALNYSYYEGSPKEEYGVEVVLAPGTPRVLKTLEFEYLSDFEAPNALVIRLYENDGPLVDGVASPGTLYYQIYTDVEGSNGGIISRVSDSFGFVAGNTIPDRLTVTMQVLGLNTNRHAGWALSEAAVTTGSVFGTRFWHSFDEGNTWSLASLSDPGGVTNSPVIAGPITNSFNGHSYYLLAEDSWQNSEAVAKTLGGHLVTINDAAEQDWVFTTFGGFGGVQRSLWIGYQRTNAGGAFSWVSGETPSYTHWADNRPDNLGGVENYAHMFRSGNAFGQTAGGWNDLTSPNTGFATYGPLCGVVEVQPLTAPVSPVLTVNSKLNQACWTAESGRGYQVQVAADPAGPWVNSGTPIVGAGTQCASLDLTSSATRRFLRVVVNP